MFRENIFKLFVSQLLALLLMIFSVSVSHAQTMKESGEQVEADQPTIYEIINNSDNHLVFTSLIDKADLTDYVSEEDFYIAYIPTDEALQDIGGTISRISADEQKLRDFVMDHMFGSEISEADVDAAVEEIGEVGKASHTFQASNGLLHSVDFVILDET